MESKKKKARNSHNENVKFSHDLSHHHSTRWTILVASDIDHMKKLCNQKGRQSVLWFTSGQQLSEILHSAE